MIKNKEQSELSKKSYQTPILRVYGNLHEITQGVGARPGTHVDSRNPGNPDRTH